MRRKLRCHSSFEVHCHFQNLLKKSSSVVWFAADKYRGTLIKSDANKLFNSTTVMANFNNSHVEALSSIGMEVSYSATVDTDTM